MAYYESEPVGKKIGHDWCRPDPRTQPMSEWADCKLARYSTYNTVTYTDGSTAYYLGDGGPARCYHSTVEELKEASDKAYREWKIFHTLKAHRAALTMKMEADLELLRLSLLDCPVP